MENEVKSNEIEFEAITLWRAFKKFWILILCITVLFAVAGGFYTKLFVKDRYIGTASFWVNGSTGSVSSAATMGAAQMATNYIELVDKDILLSRAVQNGDLGTLWGCTEDVAISRLRSMLGAGKNSAESFIFTVSAVSYDPKTAYEAISAVQYAMIEVVIEVNGDTASTSSTDYLTLVGEVHSRDDIKMISRSYTRNAAVSALVAFVVSFAVCLFLYMRDTVVYDEASLKARFTYPVVGIIPSWDNGSTSGFKRRSRSKNVKVLEERDYKNRLISSTTPFGVNEAFNMLRTNVTFSLAGKKNPVVAITSAYSGAGKSLMASNLAISFSNLGKRTLLVECDMRCPTLSKIFDFTIGDGLSDYLATMTDGATLNTVKHSDMLTIIPAGHKPPNPSELLGSDAMHALIEEAREQYDVIVLDMPPICEVADAGVIADAVDGYILAVRSGFSDMREVDDAAKALAGVNANVVGFILNDYEPKLSGRSSYYYNKKGSEGIAD